MLRRATTAKLAPFGDRISLENRANALPPATVRR
jgi:hypothetical protein